MMPLRRMITIAQTHGWIVCDPFVDYSISAESTDRDYLTKDCTLSNQSAQLQI